MGRIDVAGGGDEDEARMLGEAEAVAKLGPGRRGFGEDALRVPEMRAGLAEGACSDEHAVRAGAQESHHEAVALVAAADDPTRFRALLEGDDAVHRGDEVGEDARPGEPEIAAVGGAELFGQAESGLARLLVQQLQARKVHRGRTTRKY